MIRSEKLELAWPTLSSKNEPTILEYLELERHRMHSAAMISRFFNYERQANAIRMFEGRSIHVPLRRSSDMY